MYKEGDWVRIAETSQKGKVIDVADLWGESIVTVWLPLHVMENRSVYEKT
jgi:hypothetical protein